MYSEVAWVIVYLRTQVQPQMILDPNDLPHYLSVSYDYDVGSVVKSLKSILSFFKKPLSTVNNGADDVVNIPESSCTVVNSDVNSENVFSTSNCCSLPEKSYHPSKDFVFPKTKFGSRNRPCQHNWFDNYPWLHYDIKKDCVFCFYCMKNVSKLTAEKNK